MSDIDADSGDVKSWYSILCKQLRGSDLKMHYIYSLAFFSHEYICKTIGVFEFKVFILKDWLPPNARVSTMSYCSIQEETGRKRIYTFSKVISLKWIQHTNFSSTLITIMIITCQACYCNIIIVIHRKQWLYISRKMGLDMLE